MNKELKPCPVCRKEATMYKAPIPKSGSYIACSSCCIRTFDYISKPHLRKIWNELPRGEELEQRIVELGRDLAVESGWNKGQRHSLEETIMRWAKSEKENTTLKAELEELEQKIAELEGDNNILNLQLQATMATYFSEENATLEAELEELKGKYNEKQN